MTGTRPPARTATALPPGRYGGPSRAERLAVVAAVGALAVALLAYLVWVALHHSTPDVRSARTAYTVVGDDRVDVTFEVARRPGTPVVCTLRALDADRATVGSVEVTVEPGGADVRAVRASVATRARAVTGELVGCRAVAGAGS